MTQSMNAGIGTLLFEAIPASELDRIRAAGRDEAGNALSAQVDDEGGNPLRCCLRETRPGEPGMIIAYTPSGTAGPYAERGPVFIHPQPCDGYPTPDRYPPALSHRRQVVRAYDHGGRIADGVLVPDGVRARAVITELLARSDVALVHLRNVEYGCYNFAVRRR
ncbi:MAG TPA: DUF1203 domain-containing protein [Actinomadura sp.]|nr:DUF1203 domain-containing protein [Actinomadura sp.]